MSAPMSPEEFVSVLRQEGVRVAEYPGWKTNGRDSATGKPFGPVHMVLNHHTAGRDSLRVVASSGLPNLPAPLAHIHLAKDGTATMCSARRANHAGLMARNAYTSFLNESTTHPSPASSTGTIDGNDVAYGIEVENLGDNKDPYTSAQYEALVRINAAITRHYGWSAQSCAGHLETSIEGKIDPRGPVQDYAGRGSFQISMNRLRKDIQERLSHAPNWNPKGDNMALTDADISKVAAATVDKLLAGGGVLEGSDIDRIAARIGSLTIALTDAQVHTLGSSIADVLAARLAS